MKTKIVYQIDRAGLLVGETTADDSPLESGVWLLPAGCVEPAPPAEWPDDKWPRWNGSSWNLTGRPPRAANDNNPVAKMMAFLEANPDVAEYLAAKKG
jgi:hypothetical protein